MSLQGVRSRGWMTCGIAGLEAADTGPGVRRLSYGLGAISCLILGVGGSDGPAALDGVPAASDLTVSSLFVLGAFLDFVMRCLSFSAAALFLGLGSSPNMA